MNKFTPKPGQSYWMINSRWKVIQTVLTSSTRSKGRVAAGNAFRTEQDAKDFVQLMRRSAEHINKRWWEFWK